MILFILTCAGLRVECVKPGRTPRKWVGLHTRTVLFENFVAKHI